MFEHNSMGARIFPERAMTEERLKTMGAGCFGSVAGALLGTCLGAMLGPLVLGTFTDFPILGFVENVVGWLAGVFVGGVLGAILGGACGVAVSPTAEPPAEVRRDLNYSAGASRDDADKEVARLRARVAELEQNDRSSLG